MDDKIRASLEWILRALIEAEATAVIGAARYECSEGRVTRVTGNDPPAVHRGRRPRVRGPQAAGGSFFPSLLERLRRIDQALYAVVIRAYVHGVSPQGPPVVHGQARHDIVEPPAKPKKRPRRHRLANWLSAEDHGGADLHHSAGRGSWLGTPLPDTRGGNPLTTVTRGKKGDARARQL
jgi:hypothetical protein